MGFNLQLFSGEKTEPATPRKREEARKKGQVAKSGDIASAALVLTGFYTVSFLGVASFYRMGNLVQHFLSMAHEWDGGPDSAYAMFLHLLTEGIMVLLPFFGVVFLVALVSQAAQVGIMFTWETLMPKFSRINPLEGFKRIFSKRALIEFAKSLAKVSIIGYLAYRQVSNAISFLPGLIRMDPLQGLSLVGRIILNLATWIGILLFIIAILDYLYQRWEFEQSIKMSKQDIKDEYKQSEGDPLIRSKIRQKQRELASQRMMESVPGADVVITNPTHYAVAITYTFGEMNAPVVVAKGVGSIALRIRELAKEHGVTIVENPMVAQTLYKTTEIGQEIPDSLYPAVAEILAFVYRLKRKM